MNRRGFLRSMGVGAVAAGVGTSLPARGETAECRQNFLSAPFDCPACLRKGCVYVRKLNVGTTLEPWCDAIVQVIRYRGTCLRCMAMPEMRIGVRWVEGELLDNADTMYRYERADAVWRIPTP